MAAYELKGREQEEAGALLVGRVSWEAFHEVWPTMAEFERYNEIPKYVVSSTLSEEDVAASPWKPTTLLRSMDDVAALKQTEGGEIQVHGSARLAQCLAAAGLVDRYHLLVYPLVLGTGGKRLFADDGRQGEARAGRAGVVRQRHPEALLRRRRDAARGESMTRVTADMAVSLDLVGAGRDQSCEHPFGPRVGERLHQRWMFDHRDEHADEIAAITEARAYVMGRHMFGPDRGDWDLSWTGWWGPEPPYHGPVFVARPPAARPGGDGGRDDVPLRHRRRRVRRRAGRGPPPTAATCRSPAG